jgi:S-formylglutathione hydrolase FrmB
MHRLLTTAAVRAATCLAATTYASLALPAAAHADSAVTGPGSVTVLHVPSADSDLPVRDVYVYRPAVPKGVVLPVLYMLHGYPGHPPALARWMAPVLDETFKQGAKPFVVAIPDGNGRSHPDTEWADSVNGRTLVESSLLKKVLPAVEGPKLLPAGMRAVGGFSMGGYGAANLGLRHPNVFGQIVAISGYYHTDDLSGMFGGHPSVIAANTPNAMIRAAAGKRIQLFESTSESDPLIRHQASDFARRLRACHCVAALDVRVTGGDHNIDFVAASTPAIARFLDGGWSTNQWQYRPPVTAPKHTAAKVVRAKHARSHHHVTNTRRHSSPAARRWFRR